MFSVAKPLKSLFGIGVADDVTETLLNKEVSKASSKAGKNAVYHGGKTLASAITEGLEEMVSEGLDPIVANAIYAEAIGRPHEMASVEDYMYSGVLGAAMGGILGGGGQVVEYGQGRRVQNVFGDDGVKTLAKTASQVDDAAEAAKGAALNEMINRGDGIAAGQANELYRAVYNQEIKDLERGELAARSADAIMQRENLISPIQVNKETGETVVGRNTVQTFNEQKEVATAAVNQLAAETDLQLPEMSTEQISSAVAAIQTGIGGIDEVNLFTVGNPEARTIYEMVSGKTLPETNQQTREMLFEEIGKNRVNSARLETERTVDEIKGLITQDASTQYEAAGQEAFAQAFSDVNVGNAAQVAESLETFDDFYRAGRNGIAYADVVSAANPAHGNVSADIRQAAWQAGQQDAFIAADTARGLQMRIGETARQARSQRRSGGRLYSEISKENRPNFTASQQGMYRMLARTFGIDIYVVDSLESGANGEYHDGVIYLSMSSDRALEYVFAHEITHHMQDYAPEEYNQLKELVRTRWAQQGGIDDAIDTKMAQYARHDAKLSREQALDEIIADSTYEILQDEEFIDETVKTHRNLAQALLDAIKEVLKKLRLMIAGGDRFTPAQNEALLSELDILKEFEKMWTDGLMRAAENRAAVGSVGTEVRQQAGKDIKPFNITRNDIADNIIKVANMEPVAKMTGEEFAKGDIDLITQVEKYFSERGNSAENSVIGSVAFDRETVGDDMGHGIGRNKAISFRAIPEVIESGEIIDAQYNWKDRGYDTVVLAAPITIANDGYFMALVIRREPTAQSGREARRQRHYVHEVMIEKISTDFKTGRAKKLGAGVNADSSILNLLQNVIEVKNGTLKRDELLNRISPDEGRFSFSNTEARQKVQPFDITRSEILQNMKTVTDMSPVVTLDGSGFEKQEGRSLSQAVMDYYGGKEFYVNNSTLGEVKVGKRGIKAGTQHKLYGSKIEGFKALREVIQNGVVINAAQDYKNDGTDRIILAAPIKIKDEVYYMGAVINRVRSNDIQNYYIHDVVLEEKNNIPKDTDTDNRHGRVDVVSPYTILQQLNNINNLSEKDVISDEGRFSFKEDTDITYDSLISKPDMKVAHITTKSKDVESLDRKEIVARAKDALKNSVGLDDKGRTVVYNEDTGRDIVVGKPGIEHGLDRNFTDTAIVSMHLAEYLKSAVKINEAMPDGNRTHDSDILLGYGESNTDEKMPAYFVVSRLTTGEERLEEFGSLYSLRGKKIEDDSAQGSPGVQSRTSSIISISDLLDIVNEMYSDILPKSVAEHYGNERRATKLGESVKYSFPDESDVIDYANEHETEFVDMPPVRDYEKKQRAVRQQTYGELLAQVEKLRRDKHLTKGKVLDEKSVREEVNNLISTLMTYSESYTVNGGRRKTSHELVRDGVHAASQIYTALKNGDVYEAITTAEMAAEDIVGRLELVNDTAFHEYKELRDYLKNTRIVISEEDAANIPDFKEFKKEQANRIRIVNQNGVPVDIAYAELSERWPELFPDDVTHPADQLLEMAEVRESLEPYDIMLSAEETEQLVKQTAEDLLDIAGHGKAFKSWVDKKAEQYDERLRLVKARHKEALRDVRRNERERAERLLQGERRKWAERVNRANERADRRVQEER